MGFQPDGIRHDLHRLVIGGIGNIVQKRLHILNFQCQFFQLLLLRRQLLLLLHQDIILFFQIVPPAVGRLLIQMQPMPSGDVKQDRPADRIKGLLAVVVPAFGLLRVGERDAKFFQRLFLLGGQFPIAVLTVKDVPLMDVGRPLVQMERPVQDVDMGTEAALKFLIKLIDDGKERIRRDGFSHRADLVDTFLRAGLVVFQQVLHSAVALGVPGFLIPGVLSFHIAAVMLVVIHPLDFLKAEIRLLRVLPELVCGEAPVAVPVDILPCPFCVNVFAVLHIEPAVIVAGIIGAMLAGASKVRDLFKQAKEKAPCIVFIDEIDAIGQKRNSGQLGGNDEREQTLNQLLTEMDGFEGNSGVIILAATNRPDSLDPALTRPGRFDRRVPVELPDLKGREEILKVHARKVALAPGIDFNTVARMASGASGAELANIVNEAALRAVRAGRKSVTEADLEESIEVVIAGYQKKNSILTDKEKCIVAYHEIGHALVAALQNHSAPVQKITIIPRTSGALGYTMQVEEGNHYLMTKEELENKIATLTGGRAAEEVVFGSITTGASNDIEQATKLARAMLTRYGMSKEFDMVALETVNNQYLGGDTSLACSAQTQREIDQRVVELVKAQHEKAIKILTDNRAKLDELAKYLYEKETIAGDEFMAILEEKDPSEN